MPSPPSSGARPPRSWASCSGRRWRCGCPRAFSSRGSWAPGPWGSALRRSGCSGASSRPQGVLARLKRNRPEGYYLHRVAIALDRLRVSAAAPSCSTPVPGTSAGATDVPLPLSARPGARPHRDPAGDRGGCLPSCSSAPGIAWDRARQALTLYYPPDLRSGATLKAGEVPPASVYAFAYYIFQQLNRWPHSGEQGLSARPSIAWRAT